MSDQFLAEIRMVGFNFAPNGWAQCNGQLMSISQNTALFSLVGTYYGGDGKATFGLPNFQAATAMHQGNGAGLSSRTIGETGGEYSVTLLNTQNGSHTHAANCSGSGGSSNSPLGNVWTLSGDGRAGPLDYAKAGPANIAMNAAAIQLAGSSQPHNNLQPYLTVTFVIALQGIYPSRS
jgi:microcystin-dependent protein